MEGIHQEKKTNKLHDFQHLTFSNCLDMCLGWLAFLQHFNLMVSNFIQYKNETCQPLLGYFMPKSV